MKKTGSISKNPSSITNNLINPHPKAKEELTAVFEFNPSGYLKSIFLNSQNDRDQVVLQRGIERLVSPFHLSWVKRLFR